MRTEKAIKEKCYVPNDPDQAWVEIKHLSPGEERDIQEASVKMHTEIRGFGKEGQEADVVAKPEWKQAVEHDMTLQKVITDFGGWLDEVGEEIKYSPKNVLELSRKFPGFDAWIIQERKRIAKTAKVQIELAEKN